MSTHNIPFSIYKGKSALIIPNLQLSDFFSKGLKDEFEKAIVNEPSVFEQLKFYCSSPGKNLNVRCKDNPESTTPITLI